MKSSWKIDIKLTKTEQIIKVLCVFFIAMLVTSSIFFSITIGDPSIIVVWFGFIYVPLSIFHIISFSVSCVLALIIMGILYIQWNRGALYLTKFQIIVYFFVIAIGILFPIITHGHLLGSWVILDTFIVLEVILFSFFVIVVLRRVRGEQDIEVRQRKRDIQDMVNTVESSLYELERLKSGSFKKFFVKYVAHHFWIGVLLVGMGASIYITNPKWNFVYAFPFLLVGVILVVDDSINHIFHVSITDALPRQVKNERGYDRVGKFFTIFFIVGFLIVILLAIYAYFILGCPPFF